MIYLIDGYNITKSDPATAGLTLEQQRDALLARLRSRGRDLLGAGRIVVVFDGPEEIGHPAVSAHSPLTVVFSRGESADDVIVRRATAATERVVLVSTDRELANRVRAHAPRGSDVRERETLFEAAARRRPATRSRRQADPDVPDGANGITEELKKLWLDNGE
jgi:predicted RNA-binding protein with PIN domain